MREFELNVENEAATVTDRVKRVYGRQEEGMMVCSAASFTPIERWKM